MFSAIVLDRVIRVAKAGACILLASVILRTGYRLPATTGADVLPELLCCFTAFFLGLTALALAFMRADQDHRD